MNHDTGMGQTVPFTFRASGEKKGSHTGRLPYAIGVDGRRHVLEEVS